MLGDIVELLYLIPGILLGLTIHEFSHALAAYKLGDNTPKLAGRLTLNPLAHLDLMGTIFLLLFRFGWGKPVPIDPRNFENPRKGSIIVSIAGPLSNLVLAFLLMGLVVYITPVLSSPTGIFIYTLLYYTVIINLVLFIFNLLPVPPLDGGQVLINLIPPHKDNIILFLRKYGILLLIAVLVLPTFVGFNPVAFILMPVLHLIERFWVYIFSIL